MEHFFAKWKLDDEKERFLTRSWIDEIVLCKGEAGL